jgi:hypothetical protein
LEENQPYQEPYQEPYQDTAQNQTKDQLPTAESQENYEEDDDPDLALAMKMSLESYQEEESKNTEDQPEEVEEECDTDNESRRVRYDTMATVIEVGDDGEYRNPTPPEDIDPDLFIGADDVVDEDEDDAAGVGLVDNVAVELVSRLNIVKESQTTDDIYPADVSEFTDYLRRGKITGLRTLVRSVFSCPKVNIVSYFCHFMYFYRLWHFLSNWIRQMIYPQ